MCGRFIQTDSPEIIAQQFDLDAPPLFKPRYPGNTVMSCHPTMTRHITSPMERPIRVEFPGALYHVTSRGQARYGSLLVCLICLVLLVYPVRFSLCGGYS